MSNKLKIDSQMLAEIVYFAKIAFDECHPHNLDDSKKIQAFLLIKGFESTLAKYGIEVPFEFSEKITKKGK